MKILFDQNLSPELVSRLQDLHPGSTHVRFHDMRSAEDWEVWNFAAAEGLAIASKDSDFVERSQIQGPPPKVIYIGIGNCTTERVEFLIRSYAAELDRFAKDSQSGTIELL